MKRTLTPQDRKMISTLFLNGKYAPDTIDDMELGNRKMQPVVEDAIKAYKSKKVTADLTWQQLMAEAAERFVKFGLDEGAVGLQEQVFTQERLEVNVAYEAGDLGTEEVMMNHKAQLVA